MIFQVSKEVKELRRFESTLLSSYQKFIHTLLALIAPIKDKLFTKSVTASGSLTHQHSTQLAKRLKKRRRTLQLQHPELSSAGAEQIARGELEDPTIFKVGQTAAVCLSRLLSSVYHFNYTKGIFCYFGSFFFKSQFIFVRSDIVTHVIPLINHAHPAVAHPVYQAVVAVFEADVSGQVTVEIMRTMVS